ncbi:MAG: hypothetical protein ACYTXY_48680, partial [Nostoc sp.]
LGLRNIHFLHSDKIITPVFTANNDTVIDLNPLTEQVGNKTKIPNWTRPDSNGNGTDTKNPTNINTATKHELTAAFKGTGIKQPTIDRLIKIRSSKPYKTLDIMGTDLKFT